MSVPPKKFQITRDDAPDAPSWFGKVLEVLNPFIAQVAQALSRGLTRSENMASQVKTLTLKTGATVADSFPLTFKSDLPAPFACWVGQCLPLAGGSVTDAVAIHSWQLTASGNIEISSLSGLDVNTSYRLTFVVE